MSPSCSGCNVFAPLRIKVPFPKGIVKADSSRQNERWSRQEFSLEEAGYKVVAVVFFKEREIFRFLYDKRLALVPRNAGR